MKANASLSLVGFATDLSSGAPVPIVATTERKSRVDADSPCSEHATPAANAAVCCASVPAWQGLRLRLTGKKLLFYMNWHIIREQVSQSRGMA